MGALKKGERGIVIDNNWSFTLDTGECPYLGGTMATPGTIVVLVVSDPFKGAKDYEFVIVETEDKKKHIVLNHFKKTIKPEPKYRPFKMEELTDELLCRGIKSTPLHEHGIFVELFGSYSLDNEWLKRIFEEFRFLDGSPVGVEIEE